MTYVTVFPRRILETRTNHTDSSWAPKVDIREEKDTYTIDFALPGLEKNDFNVKIKESVLTVEGERKINVTDPDDKYYRYFEIPDGKFSRSFKLPDTIDGNTVDGTYKNGVLTLELHKKKEAKPQTIEIK